MLSISNVLKISLNGGVLKYDCLPKMSFKTYCTFFIITAIVFLYYNMPTPETTGVRSLSFSLQFRFDFFFYCVYHRCIIFSESIRHNMSICVYIISRFNISNTALWIGKSFTPPFVHS